MTNPVPPQSNAPDGDDLVDGIAPIDVSELTAPGAELDSSDEPIPVVIGPDDDPPLGPLTLKEAYGEVLGAALAWSESAQVTAVRSSDNADDAFVDAGGNCPAWSFTFVNAAGETHDLDVVNGQVVPGSYASEGVGKPLQLEDLADSPDLIARAGLDGDQFIVRLDRLAEGTLQATVQSLTSLQQVIVDPSLGG